MAATVTVRFWAGAKRAAGRDTDQRTASTLRELLTQLSAEPELARVVDVSSFLVNGQQCEDDTVLRDGAVVDVLPPFAGG